MNNTEISNNNSDKELSKHILSIEGANEKDGGEGAILIKLRNL